MIVISIASDNTSKQRFGAHPNSWFLRLGIEPGSLAVKAPTRAQTARELGFSHHSQTRAIMEEFVFLVAPNNNGTLAHAWILKLMITYLLFILFQCTSSENPSYRWRWQWRWALTSSLYSSTSTQVRADTRSMYNMTLNTAVYAIVIGVIWNENL